ncbi:hypothetical protein GGF46_002757 [Coemansia sp. RSA 552]|nr:hypothetical protein GGF46_002757 [Coemansia sp. RSA 552]
MDVLCQAQVLAGSRNRNGATPVHFAACYGQKRALVQVLRLGGEPTAVDAQDDSGRTPLMLAAFRGRTQTVSALLRRNAKVNDRDMSGWTALMYAAFTGRIAICRELLEFSATRLATDHSTGKGAVELALGAGYYEIADILRNRQASMARTPSLPDSMHTPPVQPPGTPGTLRSAVEKALNMPQSEKSHKSANRPVPKVPQTPGGLNIAVLESAAGSIVQPHPQAPGHKATSIAAKRKTTANVAREKPRVLCARQKQADSGTEMQAERAKAPKQLQRKANRVARRDRAKVADKSIAPVHMTINIPPPDPKTASPEAAVAPSISEKIKDTVSLRILHARSTKSQVSRTSEKTASDTKSRTMCRHQRLADPYKRFHDSARVGPYWRVFARIVTLWMPDFILRRVLGSNTSERRQAWREKVALCFIIAGITGAAAFVAFGLSLLLCDDAEPLSWATLRRDHGADAPERLIAVRGRIYDVTDPDAADALGLHSADFGTDVSALFAAAVDERCSGNKTAGNCISAQCRDDERTLARLRRLRTDRWVEFRWRDVARSPRLFVFSEHVYWASAAEQRVIGTDATAAVARSPVMRARSRCWGARRAGRIEGGAAGCVVARGVTAAAAAGISALIAIKLACAAAFGWAMALQTSRGMRRGAHVPYVMAVVTCYDEDAETLQMTLDAVASSNYASARTLLVAVADGGGQAGRVLQKLVSFNEGQSSSSQATVGGRVTAGAYTASSGATVACVVVAKAARRGKRDSQLTVLQWLRGVLLNAPVAPLEFALWRAVAARVAPHRLRYMLVVDGDTTLDTDCLPRLVAAMERDTSIIGACGETRVANKRASWVTRIQVYEYYIAHHLGKAFESLWGGVTCLPGCCALLRIHAHSRNALVPLAAAPQIVAAYGSADARSLHRKSLLLLGEDRYLTTLLLRAFPRRKLVFVPRAVCRTRVPAAFAALLAQRRRWINSTIHNLLELVLVRDLCGTFCCSMQFLVLVDLLGNAVLPASVVFGIYLLGAAAAGAPVALPLLLLAAAFALQAALILLTTHRISYIYWMVLYIIALPLWNMVLPLYAFWHFDDFSWGPGDSEVPNGAEQDSHGKDPPIQLKRWNEWTRDGLPTSQPED